MLKVLLKVEKDLSPFRLLELSIYCHLFFPHPLCSGLCLHTGQGDDLSILLVIYSEPEAYVLVIQNRAMEDEQEDERLWLQYM